MASKAWKDMERKVAAFFRTVRTPLSGGNSRHTRSDSLHEHLFIESKYRKAFAHHGVLAQAAEQAVPEGKLPVLATKHHGQQGFNVTISSDDLLQFCKLVLECKGFRVVPGNKHGENQANQCGKSSSR